MKKRIAQRIFAFLLVLTLMIQLPIFNSYALSPSEPEVTAASGDFVGTLQRALYFGILYLDNLENLVKTAKLSGFSFEVINDDLTIISGSFVETGFITLKYTISITVGSKNFWTGFINSPQYKAEQAALIVQALISYISIAIPDAYERANKVFQKSLYGITNGIMLRTWVNKLQSNDLLANIPSFSQQRSIGKIQLDPIEYDPGDRAITLKDGEIGVDIPENVVPAWVYDGVTA